MKRFPISMAGLIAVITGLALSAFTDKPLVTPKKLTVHFYQYTGADNTNGEIRASANWTDLGTATPTLTCNASPGKICYLHYDGDLATYQTYVSTQTFSGLQSAGIINKYRP